VKKINQSMVKEKFGMVGLMKFISEEENEKKIV
jgi:hypothetical protein